MPDATEARLFVRIHHKTFRLSDEGFNEPSERAEAHWSENAIALSCVKSATRS
jgi:hypothetical protein